MYCKHREKSEFYKLTKDNAQDILEKMGFGVQKCKDTYYKDRRFGRVEYDHICFGFENISNARFFFGRYVVFDKSYGVTYLTEDEFLEEYEICEE